jgi:TRAP-type C4-dicarboxylate transport system substrate-binding protein
MKKSKMLAMILAIVMIASVFSACAQKAPATPASPSTPAAPSTPAQPAEKPVTFRTGFPQTKGHSYYTLFETAAADMKDQSNGILNLEIFDNSQLGTDKETFELKRGENYDY